LDHVDRDQIAELTEEVYHAAEIKGQAEDLAGPYIKVTAEAQARFYEHKAAPVDEARVAETVNAIASAFNAPRFAFTTREEVHRLRIRLALLEPSFIGRMSANRPYTRSNPSSNMLPDKLSPLEAFHVTAMMLKQKTINPSFQITPEEKKERLAKNPNALPKLTDQEVQERSFAIQKCLREAKADLSLMDLYKLADASFNHLGIAQAATPKGAK
jgi:hypothetical protein